MHRKNKTGFTLVELIVVIVILAVLATIAFLSFNSQSSSARNSARLSDLRNISKAVELVKTNGGNYPAPSNSKLATFSGSEIWTQGTFGNSVQRITNSISKVPLDPLFNTEYTYSVLNNKVEFQLSATMEGKSIVQNDPFAQDVYADSETYQAMQIGTYNGMTAKVFTGGVYYFLALPSIVASNPPYTVSDSTGIYLVTDGQGNLPDSYLNTSLTLTGGQSFKVSVVMSGSSLNLSNDQIITMTKNLQSAYSGSVVSAGSQYQDLLKINTSDTSSLLSFGTNILQTELGGSVDTSVPPAYDATKTYVAGNKFSYNGITVTVTSAGIGASSATSEPGCSTKDVVIWKSGVNPYIVSACNVGATVAATGATTAAYGNYFQWGRNDALTDWFSNSTYGGVLPSNGFIGGSPVYQYKGDATYGDWYGSELGSTTPNRWSGANPQGPCQTGYHIPSSTEWQGMCNALYGSTCQWNTNMTKLMNSIYMSYSGFRTASAGNLTNTTWTPYYWTSTPSGTSAIYYQTSAGMYQLQSDASITRASGLPVKCFKN